MIRLASTIDFENDEHSSTCLDTVKYVLPDGYNYMINEFTLVARSKVIGETKFKTVFRVNVGKKEDIDGFLVKLGEKSGTCYNKFCGDVSGKGQKVVIRGYRKCHHNVRRHTLKDIAPRKKGPGGQPGAERVPHKNTECPAVLNFTLSGSQLHTSHHKKLSLTRRLKDTYPLEITLQFVHNHSINSGDALRYRPVSDEVKQIFLGLLADDYTVSSALAKYKEELRNNCTETEFTMKMANQSIVPDYFWVFHLHEQYIEKRYGTINGVDAYRRAVEKIDKYNEKHGEEKKWRKSRKQPKARLLLPLLIRFVNESTKRSHKRVT